MISRMMSYGNGSLVLPAIRSICDESPFPSSSFSRWFELSVVEGGGLKRGRLAALLSSAHAYQGPESRTVDPTLH